MTSESQAPPPPAWRRRLASGARWALLWVPLGFWLGFARPWVSSEPCWLRREGPMQLAPDGTMAVQMEYEVCEYGFLFTELRTRLEAWRVTTPEKRHTLATWEWPGGNDDKVKVAWTGPGALHVSLTAWSGAVLSWPPLAGLVLTVEQAPPPIDDARGRLR